MNPIAFTYTAGAKLKQPLIERDVIIKVGSLKGVNLNTNAAD